jgi:hypothetical protein
MKNFYFSPQVPYLYRLQDIKIIKIQDIKISHLGTFNGIRAATRHTAKALCQKFETNIPRMKLRCFVPNFYINVSVSDLYIPTIGGLQTQFSKKADRL